MADETSPLLGQFASDHSSPSRPAGAPPETSPAGLAPETGASRSKSPLYPSVVIYLFVLCFVADLGGALIDTPELRLLEMAVCRDYYHEHDPAVIGEPPNSYIDEELCKLKEIQAALAYLRAAKSLLMTIPGKDSPSISFFLNLLPPYSGVTVLMQALCIYRDTSCLSIWASFG